MLVTNNFLAALKDWVTKHYFRGEKAEAEFKLVKEWYLMYGSGGEGDCYTAKLNSLIS